MPSQNLTKSKTWLVRFRYHSFWKMFTTMSNITVTAVLIAAIELAIKWNNIPSVDAVDTTSQTIPLFLSAINVLGAIFESYWEFKRFREQSSAEDTASRSSLTSLGYNGSSATAGSVSSTQTIWNKRFTPSGQLYYVVQAPSRARTA